MTWEDNRRYIAEAWISNGKEEEFKKSFLQALVEQWQHHGNGFCADKLDGYHYEDIVQMIEDRLKQVMSEFNIGHTEFRAERESMDYYLGLDAIKLYNDEFDINENEDLLPWEREDQEDLLAEQIPSLASILLQLYNLTYFGEENENEEKLTNRETFAIYKQIIIECGEMLEQWYTKYDVNTGLLNADSVNGLRFFIYTQAQYDDLKARAKTFEDKEEEGYEAYEGDYNKLHSIHNVFIIKEPEDIIASGYEDGIYDGNPDTAVINKYYKFRVSNGMLQYTHEDSLVWHDMCPIEDFIDKQTVEDYLLEILRDNQSYEINPDALYESIKHMTIPITFDTPLGQWVRENFIHGGFYTKNEQKIYLDTIPLVDSTISENVTFDFLDLTKLFTELKTPLDDLSEDLEQYKGILGVNDSGQINEGVIGGLSGRVQGNTEELTRIKGGSENTIYNLEQSLKETDAKIVNIHNKNQWINFKDSPEGQALKANKKANSWVDNAHHNVWKNEFLGLAFIKITLQPIFRNGNRFLNKNKKSYDWNNLSTVSPEGHKVSQLPDGYKPIWTVYLDCDEMNCSIRIQDDDAEKDAAKLEIWSKIDNVTEKKPAYLNITGLYRVKQQ